MIKIAKVQIQVHYKYKSLHATVTKSLILAYICMVYTLHNGDIID